MGLENVNINLSSNKKIVTNDKWQSNVENIYAIGDVSSSGLELTPVAIKEGEYAVMGMF